jgi:hypothetical protein
MDPDGSPVQSLLTRDQLVENRQNLLAVQERTLQFLPHGLLITVTEHKLVQELPGDVDIAAEGFGGVPAQEQPIKQGSLTLRRQRIEFFQVRHRHKKSIIIAVRLLRKTPGVPWRAILTQVVCHYFALGVRVGPSWWVFGEDETISRNKETISNPAITAPTNIATLYFSPSTLLTI